MRPIRVAVVGGSGYVGLELIRLVSAHGAAQLCAVTSRDKHTRPLSALHPSLEKVVDLNVCELNALPRNLDLIFVAVPHGESMGVIQKLWEQYSAAIRIIDLGSDFRLGAEQFSDTYGLAHTAEDLLQQAVYGVPELFAHQIASAHIVANPGCFANTTILALAPLAKAGLLPKRIHVSAITGSSGSGALPGKKTHHPERAESISAYSVLKHRHVPEICRALNLASAQSGAPEIDLVPMSGPFRRGIFATCFVELGAAKGDLAALYSEFVSDKLFMRLRAESPRLNDVVGSNFCDLALTQKGETAVVLSCTDNLLKGAASNAVQCMNIMFGFAENAGLKQAPLFP